MASVGKCRFSGPCGSRIPIVAWSSPFCGGLAVTLGFSPETALLNDANAHLIHFYHWLQRGLHVDVPMENDELLFYTHRDRLNQLLRDGMAYSAEAAGLFYYLNRTGYNGLCRFNRLGEFNVPFGKHKQIGYTRDFSQYQDVFAEWTFTTGDVEAVRLNRFGFRIRGSAIRRGVHHVLEGGVHMGRSGAHWT